MVRHNHSDSRKGEMRNEDKTREQLLDELAALRQLVTELEVSEGERKRLRHDLAERVKELRLLYSIASLNNRPNITLEGLYQEVELINRLRQMGLHGMLVVDDAGNLFGVVTITDIESAISKGDIKGISIGNIASRALTVVYPDEYLHNVLVKLGAKEVGRISH